jgi:nitrogen regulatory protein PII-like uncharacterized protein
MNVLKSFVPKNFTNLSKEEKEVAVINLINDLCDKLCIASLPVVFEHLEDDEGYTICGKFIFYPLKIH